MDLKGLLSGNMQEVLVQAQKMQQDLLRVQEEAERKEVEASVGGGMVSVKVNGAQLLTAVKIDRTVLESNDLEMLQDLIRAAVNEGVRKSKELMKEEMKKITGGLPIPGLS